LDLLPSPRLGDPAALAVANAASLVPPLLARLPLAQATLVLLQQVLSPAFLNDLFESHRGRAYQDVLSFPTVVRLLGDALLRHHGSARAALDQARRDAALPSCPEAFYGKLRRVPLPLSLALLHQASDRLRDLGPTPPDPLPACFADLDVLLVDGKKCKHVAKRLAATRGQPGRVFGAKLLAGYDPRTRHLCVLAAHPDGERNDSPLVPDLLQAARVRLRRTRLFVSDAQFCDLVQVSRYRAAGDHFALRYHPKTHFHPDPSRPARTSTDAQGRALVEEWGWLGAATDRRRVYVRRVTWQRPGKAVAVVTDLTDGEAFPAADVLTLYLTRWRIEGVFQEVVQIFGLRRFIGSTPQATVFQAAFCMLVYNVMQVVKGHVAAGQAEPLSVDDVSPALLFKSLHEELLCLYKLATPAAILAGLPELPTAAAVRAHVAGLLRGVWEPLWRKARNPKPRRYGPKPKRSGAHASVQRLLDKHKQNRSAKPDS
jgi:hypothetical protein